MTQEMIEIEYNRGRTLIENNDLNSAIEAKKIFESIDYKDSKKYLEIANKFLIDLENDLKEKKEEDYERALLLMKEKKSAQRLDQAIKLFKELDDYKDSKELMEKCINQRNKVSISDKKNLNRFKALGLLFASIGLVMVVFIICAMIWQVVSNS